jgi:hypothetical protein
MPPLRIATNPDKSATYGQIPGFYVWQDWYQDTRAAAFDVSAFLRVSAKPVEAGVRRTGHEKSKARFADNAIRAAAVGVVGIGSG